MFNKEFDKIFELANGKVDDIEIFLSSSNSFSVRINNQEVESFNYADSKGIGIRVIKDGKNGYSYTEDFSDKAFEMIINEALENCKIIEKEEHAYMECFENIDTDLNLFSDELGKVDIEEKIELAKKLERLAKESDPKIINVPYCGYSDGDSYLKIANSKGMSKEFKSNNAFIYVALLAADGEEKRMAGDFFATRDFSEFNPEELAQNASRKAIDLLNGKMFEAGTYPVVFNNEMASTMLSTFSEIFSAKFAQEGQSLLSGKLNETVANSKINIIDDALYPDGYATRPFDSEGYPSQKTVLIENGVFKAFLQNSETAFKDKTKSTGNASRGYKSTLRVSPSNFYLQPGEIKRDELFTKYDKIIEIVSLQGMHSGANPISGDFSLSGEGYLWENGKRQYSLQNFTVSGNFLSLLNDIEAIADDFKFNMSSFGSAAILVKELDISV